MFYIDAIHERQREGEGDREGEREAGEWGGGHIRSKCTRGCVFVYDYVYVRVGRGVTVYICLCFLLRMHV